MLIFAFGLSAANAQEASATTVIPADITQQRTNILRLSPISALDVGVGFGLSYEKLFGKNQTIGVVIPVYLILENKNNSNNLYDSGNSPFNTYLYFTPGIKFYPSGHRKVTYALGPSLMLGISNNITHQTTLDIYGQQTVQTVKYRRVRMGAIMNNYVTVNISPSFDLGLEGGLGICYFDKETYSSGSNYYPNSNNNTTSFDLTGQFSLSIGFKF